MPASQSHSRKRNKPTRCPWPRIDAIRATTPTASVGKTSCWPSATVVVNLASPDQLESQTCGMSLRATCMKPFDQRLCWTPKSASFCGSSPTTCGSIRNTPSQPLRCVRSTRSRSSDRVSCDQPPASSTAARRQIPPVPLNWKGTPRRLNSKGTPRWARTSCSTAKCASCISRCARVSQLRSPLPHSMRVCTKAAFGLASIAAMARRSQSGGGTKSASNTAT